MYAKFGDEENFLYKEFGDGENYANWKSSICKKNLVVKKIFLMEKVVPTKNLVLE